MTEGSNALGAFLRARRELVDPSAWSLPQDRGRRVKGLRRDEVALLAGVSSHYYARLEQGRDRHPSDAVIEGLARVLRLDDAAVALLRRLASPEPERTRRARRPSRETVAPGLAALVDTWPDRPVVIVGRYRDVLASNGLARLVNAGFTPGRNLLVDTFLDPAARETYLDWEDIAAGAVAGVRASAGDDLDSPRMRNLISELSIRSEDFRRLWARHDARERGTGTKRYHTAMTGPITLNYEAFNVVADPSQTLFVFHPSPGTADDDKLRLLTSLVDADQQALCGAALKQPAPEQPTHDHC